MKRPLILIALFASVASLIGCGESVPVTPMPADGSNPHVSGTPQERIQRIQEDTSLTPEEKERRISVIKQRNNIP